MGTFDCRFRLWARRTRIGCRPMGRRYDGLRLRHAPVLLRAEYTCQFSTRQRITGMIVRFEITQAMVDRFVEFTGDRNPLHTSEEFARRFRYRRLVVHGML